jgi:hypothetical protein
MTHPLAPIAASDPRINVRFDEFDMALTPVGWSAGALPRFMAPCCDPPAPGWLTPDLRIDDGRLPRGREPYRNAHRTMDLVEMPFRDPCALTPRVFGE